MITCFSSHTYCKYEKIYYKKKQEWELRLTVLIFSENEKVKRTGHLLFPSHFIFQFKVLQTFATNLLCSLLSKLCIYTL